MTLSDLVSNLSAILPLVVIIVWASVLLVIDAWIPGKRKGITAFLAALGIVIALGLAIAQAGSVKTAFNDMLVIDGFANFVVIFVLGSGLVSVALAYDYLKRMDIERGEYYVLLMFSISGMMLMSMAADLILVFLALELLSIPLYILAAFARPAPQSEEAGLKYFLMGAFAGGFVVYGVSLIFGATATTNLYGVIAAINTGSVNMLMLTVGAALVLVGLGFKVAVVPFHMWTPDVYQGAPSAVTAFMSVGAKAGGFAALLRIFVLALPELAADLSPVLWVISALTMILGNVVAIAQSNIKRMLAYSSIAHAGYILMSIVPFGQGDVAPGAVASVLFYLVAYAFTNFGAWAVVIAMERTEGKGLEIADYAGLGRKYPALAAAMTVFMLSFTGVPPTLGFVGKFYLFRSVLDGGFVWLALIGVLTSLVSAYYYLRVVVVMYMQEGEPEVRKESLLNLTALAAAVGTVALSVFSIPLFEWTSQAILQFL